MSNNIYLNKRNRKEKRTKSIITTGIFKITTKFPHFLLVNSPLLTQSFHPAVCLLYTPFYCNHYSPKQPVVIIIRWLSTSNLQFRISFVLNYRISVYFRYAGSTATSNYIAQVVKCATRFSSSQLFSIPIFFSFFSLSNKILLQYAPTTNSTSRKVTIQPEGPGKLQSVYDVVALQRSVSHNGRSQFYIFLIFSQRAIH